MMQGLALKITGRMHDLKVPERGPKVLVMQVNHGKDKNGNFRPSTFLDVKIFPSKDDLFLSVRPVKGDTCEVTCWGTTSEWVNKEGVKQRKLEWALSHLEIVERLSDREARKLPPQVIDDDDVPF